jgi:hypothetical protein
MELPRQQWCSRIVRRRSRRWLFFLATLAAASCIGAILVSGWDSGSDARSARPSTPTTSVPTIACDEAIGNAESGRADGYRVVLGVVSVPPAYLPQVVETGDDPWAYWRKAGLVIRAESRPSVFVSVPSEWRNRAAITWASSGTVSAVRIGRCSPPRTAWYAYAGGFYLRSPSACVPLVFQVGQRTATVRFGLGRHCAPTGG